MVWKYCHRCKEFTPHTKGNPIITPKQKDKQPTLDNFLIMYKLICDYCKGRTKNKLGLRFKTKPKENFDKEGIDFPV